MDENIHLPTWTFAQVGPNCKCNSIPTGHSTISEPGKPTFLGNLVDFRSSKIAKNSTWMANQKDLETMINGEDKQRRVFPIAASRQIKRGNQQLVWGSESFIYLFHATISLLQPMHIVLTYAANSYVKTKPT